jgi:hypothetical protein
VSRVDRIVARRMEAVVTRRRPKAGVVGGVLVHKQHVVGGVLVHKQHVQGARWWRTKFAELIERRRSTAP